jgi:NAD(P)-dependent dehydrogenase (short-subunit alcohol dehydrogenase family)
MCGPIEFPGIRVNAICPGRMRKVILDNPPPLEIPYGEVIETDGFETPLEVADLVAFVLSGGGPVHHRVEDLVRAWILPEGTLADGWAAS